MEKNSCQVYITAIQSAEGQELKDTIKCSGYIAKTEKSILIEYDMPASSDDQKTKALVKLEDGQFSVVQKGGINSRMVLIPGQTTACTYLTPYGQVDFSTDTKAVFVLDDPKCILKIKAEYILRQQDEVLSENQFCLEVKDI